MEVTSNIKEFLDTHFGESTFAIKDNGSVLRLGDTVKKQGFHETSGFSVKSWWVRIQTEHQAEVQDLNGCQTVVDVLRKLQGSLGYHEDEELTHDQCLHKFIINTPSDCYILTHKSIFSLAESVSTAACTQNG